MTEMLEHPSAQLIDGGHGTSLRRQCRGKLTLTSWPPEVHDEPTRDIQGQLGAVIFLDKRKREVHAGTHARRRPHVAITHIDRISFDSASHAPGFEGFDGGPMGGGATSGEEPGVGEGERSGANADNALRLWRQSSDRSNQSRLEL